MKSYRHLPFKTRKDAAKKMLLDIRAEMSTEYARTIALIDKDAKEANTNAAGHAPTPELEKWAVAQFDALIRSGKSDVGEDFKVLWQEGVAIVKGHFGNDAVEAVLTELTQ